MRIVVLIGLLASAPAFLAAGRPDLSGTWVLVEPPEAPPDIARVLNVHQATAVRSSVRGVPVEFTTITIERQLADGIRRESYEIGIVGGTVSGAGLATSGEQRTTYETRWDGNTLVMRTGSYSGDGPSRQSVEDEDVWSLGRNRLMIVATHRATGAREQTLRLVYRRR